MSSFRPEKMSTGDSRPTAHSCSRSAVDTALEILATIQSVTAISLSAEVCVSRFLRIRWPPWCRLC